MSRVKLDGDFSVRAIAGTHSVLLALDCVPAKRRGLLGFAIKRETPEVSSLAPKWLRSQKVFRSVVPDPKALLDEGTRFSSRDHPIQSFLWGDYTATPDTLYRFEVVPMYGKPDDLKPAPSLEFEIRTEQEFDGAHGVWFNRGAIASQAFSREFGNAAPTPPENPDPNLEVTKWLSRGLLEACLRFIDETPAGDALRVAAYEFTYAPVISALRAALERGVDVRVVHHESEANTDAMIHAGLPSRFEGKRVLYSRTRTKIPHNKFIVRLAGGVKPVAVWTGSTNFTPSGFLGQSNVGHLVWSESTASQFLKFWKVLKNDPERDELREQVMRLSPDPLEAADDAVVFSPRADSKMLGWYGAAIHGADSSSMFTAAFGVTEKLLEPLGSGDALRFILMEKPPTDKVRAALSVNQNLQIAYGAVLGEMYRFKNGEPVARARIRDFELEKWFMRESHFRRQGFVFFVHTKFLLVDPLSDNPLVCTGSANFSPNSLLQNDENMLLIRGQTRVADIYLTEFDRLFRHFFMRNVVNEIAAKGKNANAAFLEESDAWTNAYFKPNSFKAKRRALFFG
jgi:PLD-like domain